MDSQNLATVQAIWRAYERGGQAAGMEAMIEASAPDAEYRLGPEGKPLHGPDQLRSFAAEEAAEGRTIEAGAYDFVESGDTVTVTGWLRVTRSDGGLSDSQVRWRYKFRDGQLVCVENESAVAAA